MRRSTKSTNEKMENRKHQLKPWVVTSPLRAPRFALHSRFNSYCAPRPTAATLGVSKADLVAHVEHEHRRASAEVLQVALDNLWEVMENDEVWEKIQQKKHKVIEFVTSMFGAQVNEDENLQDKADEAILLLPETESEYVMSKDEALKAREELKALGDNPETLHATAMAAFEQEQAAAAAAQEEEAEMGTEKVRRGQRSKC